MDFEWVNIESVDEAVIKKFDCGSHAFNSFLYEEARKWNASGESVTYAFADSEEIEKQAISRIYGFASINAIGLSYENEGRILYLPCAEIRLFAIAKQLRKRHDQTVNWSDILFKTLLRNLYQMSTTVIGFKAIFLNANHEGYQLYKDNGFEEITEYTVPQKDTEVDINECTPLLLMITNDVIYNIFS